MQDRKKLIKEHLQGIFVFELFGCNGVFFLSSAPTTQKKKAASIFQLVSRFVGCSNVDSTLSTGRHRKTARFIIFSFY